MAMSQSELRLPARWEEWLRRVPDCERLLHTLEVFAGTKVLTAAFRELGSISATFEVQDDPIYEDVLGEEGEECPHFELQILA